MEVPGSLEHQLAQMQREKMLLLNQLAEFEVPVCFSCRDKVPSLEAGLECLSQRHLANLHKLRETCVRLYDKHKSEQEKLEHLETELSSVNKKVLEFKSNIEYENKHLKCLKRDIQNLQSEQNNLLKVQSKETDKLDTLKNCIQKLQDQNHVYELNEERFYVSSECENLKHTVEVFRIERNELEAELLSIVEYLKIKKSELENFKRDLSETRQEGALIRKAVEDSANERKKLKRKLKQNQNKVENLKEQILRSENEFENVLEALEKTKETKKNEITEQAKIRNELISLETGTQNLRNMLNDYKLQHDDCKCQIKKHKKELSAAISQRDQIKLKLHETLQQVDTIDKQCNESKQLHETLRLNLLEDFTTARSKLRQLREERDNTNLEMERYTSSTLKEKLECIDREKNNVIQADKEISELKECMENKNQSIINIKKNLSDIKNEHELLKQKFEEEQQNNKQLEIEYEKIKKEKSQVIKSMEKLVSDTIRARNETFIDDKTQQVMKQFLKEFDETFNKLIDIQQESISSIKTEEINNMKIEEFLDHLKDRFIKYINDHLYVNNSNKKDGDDNLQEMEEEITSEKERLLEIKERRHNAERERLAAEEEMESFEKDLQKLSRQIESKQAQVLELQAIQDESLLKLSEAEKYALEISKRQQELEDKIVRDSDQLTSTQVKCDTVRGETEEAEATLRKLKNNLLGKQKILEEFNVKIKTLHSSELKKKNDLKNILAEIQQMEKDITTQRKKRIDMQNLLSQERVETITEKRIFNETKSEDVLMLANHGNKGDPREFCIQNMSTLSGSQQRKTPAKMSKPFTISQEPQRSPSSVGSSSSSDENIEELMVFGKIRKK